MIGRGFFREGYLDQKGTLLITDRSTYQQYVSAQTEYAKRSAAQEMNSADGLQKDADRKAEKKKKPEEAKQNTAAGKAAAADQKQSTAYREILRDGQNYIDHIRECNVKIEDAEMSAKLDRLEIVVTRIFREAEKNPDAVSELKKMMSYYLPTTRKLLDAYCEMDEQPVRGQNIENTKKEIENALDTINTAFENLLDGLFEEKAWDISSDISVLNTMLAQEGLTGTDFSKKE